MESSKFNGSPVWVTEFRGNSPDSLKKFSVLEFADGRILMEKQFGDDGSEKTYVERKFLDDGRISEISGIDSSKNVKWCYSYGYSENGLLATETSYSGSGEVALCIEEQPESRVKISVLNTGAISGEDIPHVFDRLYRGDRSRSTAGSGLGLSIAQAIAILHGGKIEVQNATNERGDACVCFAVMV